LAVGTSALVGLLTFEAALFLKQPLVALATIQNETARIIPNELGSNSKIDVVLPERRLIFSETFDQLKLVGEAPDGVWEPAYPWGARSNPANGELEYYLDPRAGGEQAPLAKPSPFRIKNGVLSIIARPTPPELKSMAQGFSYLSGLLTTAHTFSMTYGYVEVRARVPHGKGLWCAVWLLPASRSWPPEIDVMETLGDQTHTYFGSVHSKVFGSGNPSVNTIGTSDLSNDFGVYGMNWTPSVIEWFFNGKKVASKATPLDLHQPMYLLVNLAVGGHWPGSPNASTAFPANFDIDYIKVYAPAESPSPRQPG
jgi:beta-glucanase (GH16 family)